MFRQRNLLRLHSKPEVKLFLVFFILKAYMLLKFRKLDDDFIFAGKMTDSCHNSKGIN